MGTRTKYILIMLIMLAGLASSQTVNKFGIKGGLISSKLTLSEHSSNVFYREPNGEYDFLTFDVGLYVEFFDSRRFCISTELHYNRKGEDDENYFTLLIPDESDPFKPFQEKYPSNRFQYLSLQILPKWKMVVTNEDILYLFGGPKLDFRLSNSSTVSESVIEFNNSKLEAGFVIGVGNEFWHLLTTEIKYEYSFTSAYTISYGNNVVSRKHNSFYLLFGLSLKKLLRINL